MSRCRSNGTNLRALGLSPRQLAGVKRKRRSKTAAIPATYEKPDAGLPRWLRFEVFKRDGFRCTYCGAGADQTLLQVDHIHPQALGGSNAPANLTTACRDCNRGKAHRPLGKPLI